MSKAIVTDWRQNGGRTVRYYRLNGDKVQVLCQRGACRYARDLNPEKDAPIIAEIRAMFAKLTPR